MLGRCTRNCQGKWKSCPKKVKARFLEPMLLLKTDKLPEGNEWLYELKHDGYRGIAYKAGGKLYLNSPLDCIGRVRSRPTWRRVWAGDRAPMVVKAHCPKVVSAHAAEFKVVPLILGDVHILETLRRLPNHLDEFALPALLFRRHFLLFCRLLV